MAIRERARSIDEYTSNLRASEPPPSGPHFIAQFDHEAGYSAGTWTTLQRVAKRVRAKAIDAKDPTTATTLRCLADSIESGEILE